MKHEALVQRGGKEFEDGYTEITKEGEAGINAGIDFGIHRVGKDQIIDEKNPKESAWLLMSGSAELRFAGKTVRVQRKSLFDEPPVVLHLSRETPVSIKSVDGASEWAVCRTSNEKKFEPHLFLADEVEFEYRGKGLVQEACLRNVRQVFDKKRRPESNLVLGEVVNFPGRWSSYPPHHHAQPEIYHYRFTLPQGYGHAEVGEEVLKVRQGDTVKIPGGLDHAQVSAPGYGMYYLWAVRHLPGNPYTGFEFTEDHKWLLSPENQGWVPQI